MTNTNDQRILEMRKQIEAKKEKMGKATRFTPITNCIISLKGQNININTLNKAQLIGLMVELNSFVMSAKELDVLDEYTISNYSPMDWIADIKSKVEILSRKDEEKKLKLMEEKLVHLLSEGKKVELEIDDIAKLLGE